MLAASFHRFALGSLSPGRRGSPFHPWRASWCAALVVGVVAPLARTWPALESGIAPGLHQGLWRVGVRVGLAIELALDLRFGKGGVGLELPMLVLIRGFRWGSIHVSLFMPMPVLLSIARMATLGAALSQRAAPFLVRI